MWVRASLDVPAKSFTRLVRKEQVLNPDDLSKFAVHYNFLSSKTQMSAQNKQRNQKILLDLASQSGNNICADCKARLPRWASYNLGIFLCVNCASIHRKIGTHITKVLNSKSLTMDDWTKEQVETMRTIGNVNSNKIYNPNEIRYPPPVNLEDNERDSEIEQYIRAKYQYRKFFDRSAVVASKLGPPRSASLAQAPPSPLSRPAPAPSSAHTTQPRVVASTASTASYTAPPNPPQLSPTQSRVVASTASTTSYTASPNPPQLSPTQSRVVAPTTPTTSYTAPPNPPQLIPAQSPRSSGGVWDDMNSLKGNGQNSSLPLQYQSTYSQGNHPMQMPATNGAMGANNYPVGATASSIGLNPYQPNQVRTNPFSRGQSQPPFSSSSMTSSFSATPTMSLQPYGQQPFGVSQSSAPLVHQPATHAYFHPQPQTSMQIQNPSGQSFISGSPSQLFPSVAPTGQTQFLPQNHSSIPQQQYLPPSPQPIQSSSTSQFMYPNQVAPAQPQMGGHNVSGQSQFLGMTTMQMQQQQMQMQQQQQQRHPMQQQQQQQQMQQHLQQQQQQQQQQQLGQTYYSSVQPQMMSGQVSSVYGQTSVYPQGGFPPQTGGGQWGTM